MSSAEGRAGNEDFGSRSVDDHDLIACLAAVVMLQVEHTSVCVAAGHDWRMNFEGNEPIFVDSTVQSSNV